MKKIFIILLIVFNIFLSIFVIYNSVKTEEASKEVSFVEFKALNKNDNSKSDASDLLQTVNKKLNLLYRKIDNTTNRVEKIETANTSGSSSESEPLNVSEEAIEEFTMQNRVKTEDLITSFEDLDDDSDGRLSMYEINADFEELNYYDRNVDGHISKWELEFVERAEKKFKRKYLQYDKDGDGIVSFDEYEGWDKRFARTDLNKDGFLTEDEYVRLRKRTKAIIKRYDVNEDDKLTFDEFPGKKGQFNRFDKEKDNIIRRGEIERAYILGWIE